MSDTFAVKIGEKGRSVLPAGLREEAHIEVGEVLLSRVLGDGQIVLETRDAIKRRLREHVAKGAADAGVTHFAATDALRQMRDEDAGLE